MFGARSTLLLGNGETARWVAATDPVTGETIQVQATLKVVGPSKAKATAGKQTRPLELDVEVNRRLGSAPSHGARYTLRLAADGGACELRTGVKSPIRNPDDTVTFKDQGVFIGCKPRALDDGHYRLSCEIRQNGAYSGRDDWAAMGAAVRSFSLGGASVVRSFHLATVLYLRDGEAAEWAAGTDPVTRETVGIRLSLKALE
jgi:hypothetical protein